MDEFFIERKVYYHDTDSGGVVYYANYLKLLEEANTEFCLARGVNTPEWLKKGVAFAVVHVELDYKAPAQYGDILKITSQVEKMGDSSIHFCQEIKNDHKTLVKSRVVWACLGEDFKSRSLPQEVRAAFEQQR